MGTHEYNIIPTLLPASQFSDAFSVLQTIDSDCGPRGAEYNDIALDVILEMSTGGDDNMFFNNYCFVSDEVKIWIVVRRSYVHVQTTRRAPEDFGRTTINYDFHIFRTRPDERIRFPKKPTWARVEFLFFPSHSELSFFSRFVSRAVDPERDNSRGHIDGGVIFEIKLAKIKVEILIR